MAATKQPARLGGVPVGGLTGYLLAKNSATDNDLIWTAPPSGAFAEVNEVRIIYVGKHGADANDGLNIRKAKLTFSGALTAANALTPTTANPVTIVIEDSGSYTEAAAITVPAGIIVWAGLATLTITGNSTFTNCTFNISTLAFTGTSTLTLGGTIMLRADFLTFGTGNILSTAAVANTHRVFVEATLTANYIQMDGTANSTFSYRVGRYTCGGSFGFYFQVSTLTLNFNVTTFSSSGTCALMSGAASLTGLTATVRVGNLTATSVAAITVAYNGYIGYYAGTLPSPIPADVIIDGNVTTQPAATNNTQFATTAFVKTALASSSPSSGLGFGLGKQRVYYITAPMVGTTFDRLGFSSTTNAAATVPIINAVGIYTYQRRLRFTSAATAGTSCFVVANTTAFVFGQGTNVGGFRCRFDFAVADGAAVANSRCFFGLYTATTAIGNVNPSTLQQMVGVGADAGDINLSIMCNNALATANKVSLGASFPAQTLAADFYSLTLIALPGSTSFDYKVTNIVTGAVASGTITTNVPAPSSFLTPQFWRNNGATAAAVAIDFAGFYAEADFTY